MKRNKKHNNAKQGTSMSQVSHNHYHYYQDSGSEPKLENNFYLAMVKSMQEYFDRFLSGQRLYQIQQMMQQQDYFETQLEQQKSNWQDFLAGLNSEDLTPNITDIN
jgi:hypothetical protein